MERMATVIKAVNPPITLFAISKIGTGVFCEPERIASAFFCR
jgi:hypothetical protein